MVVLADVVDIRSDVPRTADRFVVDSNVWFFVTYSKASLPGVPPRQTREYPRYVERVISAGARLLRTGLNLCEIANVIERSEWQIYNAYKPEVERKAYRYDATERCRVTAEISAAWNQVETMTESAVLTIDADYTTACLARMVSSPVDAFDAFVIEYTLSARNVQIITDDGDFATVAGLQIFTCNPTVLAAARDQGKLIRRPPPEVPPASQL